MTTLKTYTSKVSAIRGLRRFLKLTPLENQERFIIQIDTQSWGFDIDKVNLAIHYPDVTDQIPSHVEECNRISVKLNDEMELAVFEKSPLEETTTETKRVTTKKSKREFKNGIYQPAGEGVSAQMWALFNYFLDKFGRVMTKEEILNKCSKDVNWNIVNARTQFCDWKRFHGLNKKAN